MGSVDGVGSVNDVSSFSPLPALAQVARTGKETEGVARLTTLGSRHTGAYPRHESHTQRVHGFREGHTSACHGTHIPNHPPVPIATILIVVLLLTATFVFLLLTVTFVLFVPNMALARVEERTRTTAAIFGIYVPPSKGTLPPSKDPGIVCNLRRRSIVGLREVD